MPTIERYRCFVPGCNAWAEIPCSNEPTAVQQALAIAADTHDDVEVHLELVQDFGFVRHFVQKFVTADGAVIDALYRGRRPLLV